ncbi:hypothetical protein AMATHDRAFT_4809 [Amanita thiersii Skay4041]|uniref:Uncharacterized protein n=1 Tax=Amanita thiersii Skay4041 TaxID=703135 RepID=A0A2A9NFY8_9AGAR|nr:hypothetical protein AMATHDRAFT_4809 [Amanita thiersii Skay4041]
MPPIAESLYRRFLVSPLGIQYAPINLNAVSERDYPRPGPHRCVAWLLPCLLLLSLALLFSIYKLSQRRHGARQSVRQTSNVMPSRDDLSLHNPRGPGQRGALLSQLDDRNIDGKIVTNSYSNSSTYAPPQSDESPPLLGLLVHHNVSDSVADTPASGVPPDIFAFVSHTTVVTPCSQKSSLGSRFSLSFSLPERLNRQPSALSNSSLNSSARFKNNITPSQACAPRSSGPHDVDDKAQIKVKEKEEKDKPKYSMRKEQFRIRVRTLSLGSVLNGTVTYPFSPGPHSAPCGSVFNKVHGGSKNSMDFHCRGLPPSGTFSGLVEIVY